MEQRLPALAEVVQMVDISTQKGIGSARRISVGQAIVEVTGPSKGFEHIRPILDLNLRTSNMNTATNKPLFNAAKAEITSASVDLSAKTKVQVSMGKKVITSIVSQEPTTTEAIAKQNSLSYTTKVTPLPNHAEIVKSMASALLMLLALQYMARSVLPKRRMKG